MLLESRFTMLNSPWLAWYMQGGNKSNRISFLFLYRRFATGKPRIFIYLTNINGYIERSTPTVYGIYVSLGYINLPRL